jgi:hypothetical protein
MHLLKKIRRQPSWSEWKKKKILPSYVKSRVARFFWVQYTKAGKNIYTQNYLIPIKYTQWSQNNPNDQN